MIINFILIKMSHSCPNHGILYVLSICYNMVYWNSRI
nr:MAG TPA: hypothetical protein [Caudoviricetes sp.]